jgi:hypothetical protein
MGEKRAAGVRRPAAGAGWGGGLCALFSPDRWGRESAKFKDVPQLPVFHRGAENKLKVILIQNLQGSSE